MNGLSLYSGSGIGDLALKHILPGFKTVCYVENEPYCQAVILSRIQDGLLDDAPIWDDVRTFDGRAWAGKVDFISGGFPCQPFSVAGQRKGEADDRNMWPDTIRIVREVRPRYCLFENVPGLLTSGYFGTIIGDLAEIGYDAEWDVVSAAFVGANHLRKRLWILAYPSCERRRGRDHGNAGRGKRSLQAERSRPAQEQEVLADSRLLRSKVNEEQATGTEQCSQTVADTTNSRSQRSGESDKSVNSKKNRKGERNNLDNGGWWEAEPDVGRVASNVPFRVDRLKMLGNGWVPAVVGRILKYKEIELTE